MPIFKRITEDEFMKFDNLSARQRRNLYADIRDKQNYETKQMVIINDCVKNFNDNFLCFRLKNKQKKLKA